MWVVKPDMGELINLICIRFLRGFIIKLDIAKVQLMQSCHLIVQMGRYATSILCTKFRELRREAALGARPLSSTVQIEIEMGIGFRVWFRAGQWWGRPKSLVLLGIPHRIQPRVDTPGTIRALIAISGGQGFRHLWIGSSTRDNWAAFYWSCCGAIRRLGRSAGFELRRELEFGSRNYRRRCGLGDEPRREIKFGRKYGRRCGLGDTNGLLFGRGCGYSGGCELVDHGGGSSWSSQAADESVAFRKLARVISPRSRSRACGRTNIVSPPL